MVRRIFAAWWIWLVVFAASVGGLFFNAMRYESEVYAALERAQQDVGQLAMAVEVFRQQEGRYPTDAEGLAVLVESGVLRSLPEDPSGTRYAYRLTPGVPPFRVGASVGGDDVAIADPGLLLLAFTSLVVGFASVAYSVYRWLLKTRGVCA